MIGIWVINQNSLAAGADDFVLQVKTDNAGTSANNEFTIQTLGSGYNYNVDCDFDGFYEITGQVGDVVCSYGSAGIKIIRIEDNNGDGTGFPRIYYNNTGDHRKIVDIVQWGTGKWTSMGAAFRGANNMTVTAGDVPDLTAVTNLSSMFRFASLANPDTTFWDVSHVTTMHSMFRSASAANPNTSNWNTSNVTLMTDMFRNAISANPDVSSWDITQVTDMGLMFDNVTLPTVDYDAMLIHFSNQNISNAVVFNGGNSQYCSIPAQNARASLMTKGWTINDGNQCANNDPLNDFVFTVISNNSPTDSGGFTIPTTGATYKYNVDCNNDGSFEAIAATGDYTCDYSSLGGAGTYTIRIQDAKGDKTGFHRIDFATSTEGDEIIDISQWGTSVWSTMQGAFTQTSNLQISATDAPDLSQVTSLEDMFNLSISLTTVGSNWNTSNITNMNRVFYFATNAQPQTSSWVTGNVNFMAEMFKGAFSAQPDTSNWNTANVKNMAEMFNQAYVANPDTSGWNIEQVLTMQGMFFDVTLPTSDYDAMLIGFNSQNVQSGVDFHGGNSKYCSLAAVNARSNLISSHSWTINDGGFCPPPAPTTVADMTAATDTQLSFDNSTYINNPDFAIECSILGNTMHIYTNNPAANTELANHTCTSSGSEVVTVSTPMVIGNHMITYTDEDANGESGHSPALKVVIKDDVFTMLQQVNYIKASNTGSNDLFGGATAISGNTLVIGARGEDNLSGAVYVFVKSPAGIWSQEAMLKASNFGSSDTFGSSVDIFDDTVVVGAPLEDSDSTGNGDSLAESGAVYIFKRTGTTWAQQAMLKASNADSNDNFGSSVSISADKIAIAATGEDSSGTGIFASPLTNNILTDSGAVYIYTRTGETWNNTAFIKTETSVVSQKFGYDLSLYGDTLVVSTPFNNSDSTGVYIDESSGSNGGAINSGAVYVFDFSTGNWLAEAFIKASNTESGDNFGQSVALYNDTIVVGAKQESSNSTAADGDESNNNASGAGAAYVFVKQGSNWSQQAYLKASRVNANDNFGFAVDVFMDSIIVGSYQEDSNATGVNGNELDNTSPSSGAAYIFTRNDNHWNLQAYLKASNTNIQDFFGSSVSVQYDTFIATSPLKDGGTSGISNSTQNNQILGSGIADSGAAYMFSFESLPELLFIDGFE